MAYSDASNFSRCFVLFLPLLAAHLSLVRCALHHNPDNTGNAHLHHPLHAHQIYRQGTTSDASASGGVRYAFCVTGQVRSFDGTYLKLKDILVDTFGENNASARDLFLVLDPHCSDKNTTTDVEHCATNIPDHEQKWRDYLQPKRLMVFNQTYKKDNDIVPENGCNDDKSKRMLPNREGYFDASFYQNHLKQELCYGMVKEQEKLNGWKYDWIVSTRPDKPWTNVGQEKLDPNYIYTLDDCNVMDTGGLICDMFWFPCGYRILRQRAILPVHQSGSKGTLTKYQRLSSVPRKELVCRSRYASGVSILCTSEKSQSRR
ncbi:hypothetical protein CYMTET_4464 [Cymbomonas tetramitiformis]|uniref:Uncharacterized protein n=1 Tax=Cymbomonas tetramitiformis TaxID=36881 RepID=A0AAE0LK31_9CHLO|nr:hypothetical protein CYMTET_4464 [Cymbomonas tetramitiformis]